MTTHTHKVRKPHKREDDETEDEQTKGILGLIKQSKILQIGLVVIALALGYTIFMGRPVDMFGISINKPVPVERIHDTRHREFMDSLTVK